MVEPKKVLLHQCLYLLHIRLIDDAGEESLFPLRVSPFPNAYRLRGVVFSLRWRWSAQGYDKQGVWRDVHCDHAVWMRIENAFDWNAGSRVPYNKHAVLSSIGCYHPLLVMTDSDGADTVAMPLTMMETSSGKSKRFVTLEGAPSPHVATLQGIFVHDDFGRRSVVRVGILLDREDASVLIGSHSMEIVEV